jgi:hypothetical protein
MDFCIFADFKLLLCSVWFTWLRQFLVIYHKFKQFKYHKISLKIIITIRYISQNTFVMTCAL